MSDVTTSQPVIRMPGDNSGVARIGPVKKLDPAGKEYESWEVIWRTDRNAALMTLCR